MSTVKELERKFREATAQVEALREGADALPRLRGRLAALRSDREVLLGDRALGIPVSEARLAQLSDDIATLQRQVDARDPEIAQRVVRDAEAMLRKARTQQAREENRAAVHLALKKITDGLTELGAVIEQAPILAADIDGMTQTPNTELIRGALNNIRRAWRLPEVRRNRGAW